MDTTRILPVHGRLLTAKVRIPHGHYQYTTSTRTVTHGEGVSLLPGDGCPPGGLPGGLGQRLGHHEDDEHEVEGGDQGRHDDYLGLPVL